jgi:hypothetical protein
MKKLITFFSLLLFGTLGWAGSPKNFSQITLDNGVSISTNPPSGGMAVSSSMTVNGAIVVNSGPGNASTLALTIGSNLTSGFFVPATGLISLALNGGQVIAFTTAGFVCNGVAYSTFTPTIHTFLSGSGTYTTPTGVQWIKVRACGGGGGGGGSGTSATLGGIGGATFFGLNLTTATAGNGGSTGTQTAGAGISVGGDLNWGSPLAQGAGASLADNGGSPGTGSVLFNGAGTAGIAAVVGSTATVNTGGGGGGGGGGTGLAFGGGGTAGGCFEKTIGAPAASYPYTVGAGGTAGLPGSTGFAGGGGAAGIIIVEEHYSGG